MNDDSFDDFPMPSYEDPIDSQHDEYAVEPSDEPLKEPVELIPDGTGTIAINVILAIMGMSTLVLLFYVWKWIFE